MSEDIIATITPCQITLRNEEDNQVEYKGWTISCTNKKKINITIPLSAQYTVTPLMSDTHLDLDYLVDARILAVLHTPAFKTNISEAIVPSWARLVVYTSKGTVEFIGTLKKDEETQFYTDSVTLSYS